jgi:hypothetical protein
VELGFPPFSLYHTDEYTQNTYQTQVNLRLVLNKAKVYLRLVDIDAWDGVGAIS